MAFVGTGPRPAMNTVNSMQEPKTSCVAEVQATASVGQFASVAEIGYRRNGRRALICFRTTHGYTGTCFDFEEKDRPTVRLVGMWDKDLQKVFKMRSVLCIKRQAAPLHPAAGHHRQHDQGVQHQSDLGYRDTVHAGRRAAVTLLRQTDLIVSRS